MVLLRLVLIIAAAAYIAILAYMYLQQRNLQYFPGRTGTAPGKLGLVGVSEERVKTKDGETIVLWYSPAKPGLPTVLYFQGNGGELADRTGRMAFYQSEGFGALFVSYRGYGGSTGEISEAGFITDALTAYDFLIARGVAPGKIAVVGESLGTGVAVQLAAQRTVGAVALEAPYTAASDVGAERYWWLPVRLLMKDQYRSRDYIAKVKVPLLIQHGDRDGVIPVAQGSALFKMANDPKELTIVPGGTHDIISDPQVWARETAFFRRWIGPQ